MYNKIKIPTCAIKVLILLFSLFTITTKAQIINTVVGGAPILSGVPAISVSMNPQGIVHDVNGNLFVADVTNNVIRKINPAGIITTVAGTGVAGYSGDGGYAINARLYEPSSIAIDASGNLYIADALHYVIRKVASNGMITTIAGNGIGGYSGDGGLATQAKISFLSGTIIIDNAGNLFFSDMNNNVIRKISNGIITTIAGNGTNGNTGDGGLAFNAQLNIPSGLAIDGIGNLYIKTFSGIRMVNNSGIISTYSSGSSSFSWGVGDLVIDNSGILYTGTDNYILIKIGINGIIDTLAGNGTSGYSGDGGLAINAQLNSIFGTSSGPNGDIYISTGNVIRKISSSHLISTIAGLPPSSVELGKPTSISRNSDGSILISNRNSIEKYSLGSNVLSVYYNYNQSGSTFFNSASPNKITTDSVGNCFFSSSHWSFFIPTTIFRKGLNGSLIQLNAGPGTHCGYCGDGNLIDSATTGSNLPNISFLNLILNYDPIVKFEQKLLNLTLDHDGNLYFTDYPRVRKINSAGIVTNFAGDTLTGYSGDGGLAVNARLRFPTGLAADRFGNVFIADDSACVVRKVDTNGIITTIVGNGIPGYTGDGGYADSATLRYPNALAVDDIGNLYISDAGNHAIRKVSTSGIITTIVGNGTPDFSGDGGLGINATLNSPSDICVDPTGSSLFICDAGNNRIRLISNLNTPEICMVTVDDNSQNNQIFWDGAAYYNVDSFYVYRETNANPSQFSKIAAISADSLSIFTDTVRSAYSVNGDPNITTYRYKIQYKDTNNNYSFLSKYHNSIYLNSAIGNFSWNNYDIENNPNPVSSYKLKRDNLGDNNWVDVGTTAGSQTNLNDPLFNNFGANARWKVETIWGINCEPTRSTVNTTRSNIRHNALSIGIQSVSTNSISIAPNPTNEQLTINSEQLMKQIKIIDVLGSLVYDEALHTQTKTIDVSAFAKGVYTVEVLSNGNRVYRKLMVE